MTALIRPAARLGQNISTASSLPMPALCWLCQLGGFIVEARAESRKMGGGDSSCSGFSPATTFTMRFHVS